MGNITEKWDCPYCGKKNVNVKYQSTTYGFTYVNISPPCCSDTTASKTQIEWSGGKAVSLRLHVGTKNIKIPL